MKYPDVQKEIDSMMHWKFSKKSDRWLQSYQEMVEGGKLTQQENNKKLSKKVDQYNLDGSFIQTFESVKDAARYAKVDTTAIRRVCQNKQKTSAGFIWKYHQ